MHHKLLERCLFLSFILTCVFASPRFSQEPASSLRPPVLALRQAGPQPSCYTSSYTSSYTTIITTVIPTVVPTVICPEPLTNSATTYSAQSSIFAGQTQPTGLIRSTSQTQPKDQSKFTGQSGLVSQTQPATQTQPAGQTESTGQTHLTGQAQQTSQTQHVSQTQSIGQTQSTSQTRSVVHTQSADLIGSSTAVASASAGSIIGQGSKTTITALQSLATQSAKDSNTSTSSWDGGLLSSSIIAGGVSVTTGASGTPGVGGVSHSITGSNSASETGGVSIGVGRTFIEGSRTELTNTGTGSSTGAASTATGGGIIAGKGSTGGNTATTASESTKLTPRSSSLSTGSMIAPAGGSIVVGSSISTGSSKIPPAGESTQRFSSKLTRGTASSQSTTSKPILTTFRPTQSTASGSSNSNTGPAGPSLSCDGSGGAATVSITISQPTICTTSALQYSLYTTIPTGYLQVNPDMDWGAIGSIWNFTLGNGAQFSSLKAACQGSTCTEQVSPQTRQGDGQIIDNPDGVWSLNVTYKMASDVFVAGLLCGGNPINGKVGLTITSTPSCALPIAQNCTNSTFDPSSQQWEAHSVDSWLGNYTAKNNIQTYVDLYTNLTNDYLSPSERDVLICTPDSSSYSCDPPSGTNLQQQCTSEDATQGLLALWAIIRISNMLRQLWSTFQYVGSDVSSWVNNIVAKFLVPSVEQKWQAIVAAVSSIIGVLVFLFILLDALTEGATTGVGVAIIVGITNALGAAANFANGFWTQKPDDTYLIYTGQYDQGVTEYVNYMSNGTTNMWAPDNPAGFGGDAVKLSVQGGKWTDLRNPLDVPYLGDSMKFFFDTLLLTSLINQIWKNNGFYIVFVPYGQVTDWHHQSDDKPGLVDFEKDECANHWANDPKRPNYINCDLSYDGNPGMTILAEPSKDGGTISLASAEFEAPDIKFKFNPDDLLQSSLDGQSQYGWNYNYTTDQLRQEVLGGGVHIQDSFISIPPATPGFYNLNVCVITQKSYIPGSRQYELSNLANDYLRWWYPDPCICADYKVGNETFSQVVPEAVKNATTTDKDANYVCTDQISNIMGTVDEQPSPS